MSRSIADPHAYDACEGCGSSESHEKCERRDRRPDAGAIGTEGIRHRYKCDGHGEHAERVRVGPEARRGSGMGVRNRNKDVAQRARGVTRGWGQARGVQRVTRSCAGAQRANAVTRSWGEA